MTPNQQSVLPLWSLMVRHLIALSFYQTSRTNLVKDQSPIKRRAPYAPPRHRLVGGRLASWGGLLREWRDMDDPRRWNLVTRFCGLIFTFGEDMGGALVVHRAQDKAGRWHPRPTRRPIRYRRQMNRPDTLVRVIAMGSWLYIYADLCSFIRPFRS
jgi:hypothetical protein